MRLKNVVINVTLAVERWQFGRLKFLCVQMASCFRRAEEMMLDGELTIVHAGWIYRGNFCRCKPRS